MSLVAESEALHGRVRAFAEPSSAAQSRETFDAIALDIAGFQARHSPGFARLVGSQSLSRVSDIPSVPTDAFRLSRVAVHDAKDDTACFVTSGTTGSERGTHYFRTTATYERLSVDFGRCALIAEPRPHTVLALAERPGPRPVSSLGFMLERFAEAFDGRGLEDAPFRASDPLRYLLSREGIDLDGLRGGIALAESRDEPVVLLATSFALVALLDALGASLLPLPRGSVVMQTGGYKGKSRALDPAVLRAALAHALAVSELNIVAEYGMTELSSQLYEGTLPGAALSAPPFTLLEPPWLRVVPVDPISLEPGPRGDVGLARFIDLANIDSAVAILTRDLVRRTGPGIELVGRSAEALPRGCSLAVEALLAGARAG
jgi:hypothetical protein